MSTRRPDSWAPLVFAAAVASAVGCRGASLGREQARGAADASVGTAEERPSQQTALESAGSSIADVAKKVTPSVVNVFSERTLRRTDAPEGLPFSFDPFFPFWSGRPGERPPALPDLKQRGLGSGVIVDPTGVIVTNNHVIDEASTIRVALSDGRELDAKLVGADPKSDLAVLRVAAGQLPAIEFADSSKTRIGEVVLAIGNPFGVGQTVTMGIISATGRANVGIAAYEDFLQTDAAINPGNSGGALVNMDGQLVGINTAIASQTGGYQGVGFAIPSSMVKQVETQILERGKVIRGWLGVTIQELTSELAAALKVAPRSGVLVSDVAPDGPAATAGVRRGDIITAVDGVLVRNTGQLRNVIAAAGKEKPVKLDLLRDGKPMTLSATLGELPSNEPAGDASREAVTGDAALSGVAVEALDGSARERLGIPERIEGVLVTGVRPGSGAAGLGLQPGDVVLEVNRAPTPDVDAFRRMAAQTKKGALVLIYREGATLYLSMQR